jgi:hypothetical protein
MAITSYNFGRFSSPGLRVWVPSPLGGEGQDEGNEMATILLTPLTLALSPAGRGNPCPHGQENSLKLGPMYGHTPLQNARLSSTVT